MYNPIQLQQLVNLLISIHSVEGSIVEIGCDQGWTTCYLLETLKNIRMKRPYICIDTFTGFLKEDKDFEYEYRHKKKGTYDGYFKTNSKKYFDFSMRIAGYDNVHSHKADAATFNYSSIAPIAFCLLDVDLYRPVKVCLPAVYENLNRGGIIVVDDCVEESIWDGAYQAYVEFARHMKIEPQILCEKLGIIQKL